MATTVGTTSVTVRTATLDLLRTRGLTTVFGNPGSTELPLLRDFPSDFHFVLGLQEAAVVGMADGYAQLSGRTALVNLHTAPGLGNAMGAIVNAAHNHTPLLITAGQQVRPMVTLEALLTNTDPTTLPRPAVKWAYEPPRAQDVPAALARATQIAETPPRGPVFVSLPMDDFGVQLDEQQATAARQVGQRIVHSDTAADAETVAALAKRIAEAANPVLVTGGSVDVEGAWEAAVTLAERQGLPVWASPIEGRVGFPEDHPYYRGALPDGIAPLAETLSGHDLILVAGAPVFRYYPYEPGPFLPTGAELHLLTSNPDEAARAPVGDAIVAGLRPTLELLLQQLPDRSAPPPQPAAGSEEQQDTTGPDLAQPPAERMSAQAAMSVLAEHAPQNALWVHESPSNLQEFRQHIPITAPESFLMTTGGGLGFGLPAAVGAALADRDRPVVCVLGDGSAQYSITALWTAAAHQLPVTFVILRNHEYGVLKSFADFAGTPGVPGLNLPGIDLCSIAAGYGVPAHQATGPAPFAQRLRHATAAGGPALIEVPITGHPN